MFADDQEVQKIITLINKLAPELVQVNGDSKWTEKQILFRYPDDVKGSYYFAISRLTSGKISWHMMPYYGIPELQLKWQEKLRAFSKGKSCIHFYKFDELPHDAITAIVEFGSIKFRHKLMKKPKHRS